MGLFRWIGDLFDRDERPAVPQPAVQKQTAPIAPSRTGMVESRTQPGVWTVPSVTMPRFNPEGLSAEQRLLNTATGGSAFGGTPNPAGRTYYMSGNGAPYDPDDIRAIVDRKNRYYAERPSGAPTPSVARAGAPLQNWNYSQPGVAYGPGPAVLARPMPALAPAPGLQDWGVHTAAPVMPGTAQGPLRAVAPVAPAQAMAPAQGPFVSSRFDPATASTAMQRYLTAAGWEGAPVITDPGAEMIDVSTQRILGPHGYQVPRWQQEQIAADYGVAPLKGERMLHSNSVRTGQVGAADWARLTPQQRSAMEFNQLLIDATQADRRTGVAPKDQDKEYKKKVEELFGEQGGSQVYAPRTVELLRRLGMGDLAGQDLDEYLSLDRAYDANEIRNLKPWQTTPTIGPYVSAGVSAGPQVQLALDQRQIDLAGGLLEKARADTSINAWDEQSLINQYLGNRPAVDQIPFGWLKQGESRTTDEDNAKEELFQKMYDHLSSHATEGMDDFWQATKNRNFTDADYDEIYDYFYQRSLEDDRLGPVDADHRTGAETRKFIGIG